MNKVLVRVWCVCLVILMSRQMVAQQLPELKLPYQGMVAINNGWLYSEATPKGYPVPENNKGYTKINLPHTWNTLDVLRTKNYRREGSWYKKTLIFTNEQLKKRNYLRIGAAGQQAKVFVNGTLIAHHIGGYAAFHAELTDQLIVGKNNIDIWVSNENKADIAPKSGDFNFYGGLYRSVYLITAPNVSVSRNYYGSSALRVWSEKVSKKKSDVNIQVVLDNGMAEIAPLKLVAHIYDGDKLLCKKAHKVTVAANKTHKAIFSLPTLKKPKLWSPEHPNLYKVVIEVYKDKKKIDVVTAHHGFRWYKFTADKGFFLNGEPYKLKGVNRHQDYYKEGNALSLDRHYKDISLIKEAGVNWLRLAHYQQDDYVLQLCDEMGILAWEEIPYVNNTSKSPSFKVNLNTMLKDMIEQHFNHPAIILWGIGNEVWVSNRGDGKANNYDLVKYLHNRIHEEDPVRKSVFVNGDNNKPSDLKTVQIVDVFGYNLYRGWYKGNFDSLTTRLEQLHKMDPKKPLILSEFGAGSDTRVHSDHPKSQDFSIEYQNAFLSSHLDQIEKLDWLSGVNWWAFADFGAAHRGDTKPHVNQKGLVTFTREKKDAFYIVKSKWSKEPVLYVESPFNTERTGSANKKYRVFTNMDKVEFFLNDISMGTKTKNFEWNIKLVQGKNTVKAIGTKGNITKEHGFELIYDKNRPTYTATATSANKDRDAKFAVDGKENTYWAAKKGSSITVDLGKIQLVDGVQIVFEAYKRKAHRIVIKGAVSKESEGVVLYKGKTNNRAFLNNFVFKEQQEIRYITIVLQSEETIISEIKPVTSLVKHKKNLYEKVGAGL